jgi:excisionase family DNA binding protein
MSCGQRRSPFVLGRNPPPQPKRNTSRDDSPRDATSRVAWPPAPTPSEDLVTKLDTTADMLTVKEAADMLRVNVKTIHKLLASGDLPHLRLGRVIRIDRRMLLSKGKAA